ncbi:MFS transporter, partial [Candidatus Omnitrophota bacterium]
MNREVRPATQERYIGNFLIFLSNAFLIGIGGLPWGAFVAYFSVLTFFVISLGYGEFGIPLVNAIFWLGFALPQLPAAYFLEANPIKKNWFALLQLIGSLMFLVFGIFMIIVGDSNTFAIFLMFIVLYTLGCLATGGSTPLNYALLCKIVPSEKLGKLLGIFFVFTTFASIIGGVIVTKVMGLWPVERSDPNFSLTA